MTYLEFRDLCLAHNPDLTTEEIHKSWDALMRFNMMDVEYIDNEEGDDENDGEE